MNECSNVASKINIKKPVQIPVPGIQMDVSHATDKRFSTRPISGGAVRDESFTQPFPTEEAISSLNERTST